jgi:hypothetical protein
MVNKTLMPTLPHKMVANKYLESFLKPKTVFAALLPFLASTSKCKRLTEKRLNLNLKNSGLADTKNNGTPNNNIARH